MSDKNLEKTIDELEYDNRKRKRQIIVLIIIIIILLLLLWGLGYKIGKIGCNTVPTPGEPTLKIIRVSDNKVELDEKTELDIFANEKYNYENKIAPRSKGSYKFFVKNVSANNLSYNIKFSDFMTNPVNMKYKLKIDNVYIRGNASTYVDLSELNVDEITVQKDSNNVFTLEWYWEDDDKNDTQTGRLENQYYILNLEVAVN